MCKRKVHLILTAIYFILLSKGEVFAQMSGSYTVGSGGAYATISEAIADINSNGLSGDVTLNILNGFYAERIDLSNLNNGAFTVILEGEAKQTTIISPPNQDAASIKAGIVMQATHNVTLRNFTYNMSEITDNTSNLSQNIYGIYMEDASNITIEESILINSTLVIDYEYEISNSIYMYNTNNVNISATRFEGALQHIEFDYFTDLTISGNTFENAVTHIRYSQSELSGGNGAPGNNLTVENNTFTGSFNGIQTSVGSLSINPLPSNLIIENNEFNDQESFGIRIFGYEAVDIVGNTITSDVSSMRAMQIGGLSGSKISSNVIDASEGSGIYLFRSDDVQLYNNIVSSKGFPIELYKMTNSEVIHNTFHANGNNALRSTVAWIYGDSENLTLKNNIFSGQAPGMGADENIAIEFLGEHVNLVQDHNLFDADLGIAVYGASGETFINGTPIFHEDHDLSELSAWSAHVSLDQHSQSPSPVFVDEIDFRIDNSDFRFGTFLSDYSTDIDGETRVDGSVDVGADQYCINIENTEAVSACESYDFAGLTLTESGEYIGEFVATNGCDSLVTLQLTILEPNAGSDDITAEGSYDWNGIIYSETGTYEQTLTNQVGCDSVATLNLTIEPYFLEGSFVIGSSGEADYSNFTEAIADLQYATLTGDVVYSVEAGTYNDTLKISNINNGDFSITFAGEDKATTILHPLDSIDESSSGILIDGTNHVTIQNITFEMDNISDVQVSRNSNDTKGISVVNADEIILNNIELKNNSETGEYTASTFYIATVLYTENTNELTVSNCAFSGAGNYITLGEFSDVDILDNTFSFASKIIRNTETGSNLLIQNNDVTGPFRAGFDLDELEDVSIQSNILDGLGYTTYSAGISLSETKRSTVKGNTVKNISTGIELGTDTTTYVEQNTVLFVDFETIYSDPSADLRITNNFLGDLVYLVDPTNLDLVHNTIVCQTDRDQAVYVENPISDAGVAHSMVNNIIVGGDQVETVVEIVGLTDPSVLTMDHNLYYLAPNSNVMAVTSVINYNGTAHGTLADWQTGQVGTTFDQNSQSFTPAFVDTDDFHISSATDYRFGTFIGEITTDIDDDIRDATIGVDVGADQFCLTYDEVVDIEVCEPYTFDGVELTTSGQYQASFLTAQSCDSLVTLNLTILEPAFGSEDVEACESYDWNGITYTASGTYQEVFMNAVGCDSTATLNLTILESDEKSVEVSACDGYEFDGSFLTSPGEYTATFINEVGCDSLVNLNLTILEPTSSSESVEVCDSYDWNGTTYSSTGIYQEVFTNAVGCDSTATLDLTILETASCTPLSSSDEIHDLSVSPNPTRGLIMVQGVKNNARYYISDLSGRVIQEGKMKDSSLKINAGTGAYLLFIPSVNKVVRLVKVK